MSTFHPNKPGRDYTVSIALPGAVMDTVSTPQLRSYLASQIARAAAIFQVDEIVIFCENGELMKETSKKSDANLFLSRLLQYIETPQYLRKLLFPRHRDFQYAGVCHPLRSPHHLSVEDESPFREGVSLSKTFQNGDKLVSLVEIGLDAV